MSERDSGGPFLAGLLLGGLVGAAAALLMTPQSGQTTRGQIQTRGTEVKAQVADATTRVQERSRVVIQERLPSRQETPVEQDTEFEEVVDVLPEDSPAADEQSV